MLEFSATVHGGITINDGSLALAVVDSSGKIVAQGDLVAEAALTASIEAYRQHLRGLGYLTSKQTLTTAV